MTSYPPDAPRPPWQLRLKLFLFGPPTYETYPQFIARLRRRERRWRVAGYVGAIVLACALSWCAAGAYVGSLP